MTDANEPDEIVYTLDAEQLATLRARRGTLRDPVSSDELASGDQIVFCSDCVRPHLLRSWRGYVDRCSCWRGVQTTVPYPPFHPQPVAAPSGSPRKNFWTVRSMLIAIALVVLGLAVAAWFIVRSVPGIVAGGPGSPPAASSVVPVAQTQTESPAEPLHRARPLAKRPAHPKPRPAVAFAAGARPKVERPDAPLPADTQPIATPHRTETPQPAQTPEPTDAPKATEMPKPSLAPSSAVPPRRTAVHLAALPARVAHGGVRASPAVPVFNVDVPLATATAPPREAPAENKSCVTLNFSVSSAPRRANGMVYEKVHVDGTFFDGHTERAFFPYEWEFTEETNPWSSGNLRNHPDMVIKPQLPPPSADVSSYPPLVQLVLKHTDSDGRTDLVSCRARP